MLILNFTIVLIVLHLFSYLAYIEPLKPDLELTPCPMDKPGGVALRPGPADAPPPPDPPVELLLNSTEALAFIAKEALNIPPCWRPAAENVATGLIVSLLLSADFPIAEKVALALHVAFEVIPAFPFAENAADGDHVATAGAGPPPAIDANATPLPVLPGNVPGSLYFVPNPELNG